MPYLRRHWPLADTLRAELARARISNQRLAEEAGLHPTTISRILMGRVSPGELATWKLGEALDRLGVRNPGVRHQEEGGQR